MTVVIQYFCIEFNRTKIKKKDVMKKSLHLLFGLLLLGSIVNAQPTINDPFFDHVNYVGAFGDSDWTAGWCEWDPQNEAYPATTITVNAGDITTNTTWTSGNTYLLNGWVYVTSGVTLTIQPGTVIRGDYVNKGSLIIERGATLNAQGTAANPIVFTSNEDPGNRDYGDWGGLILCGRATINQAGDTAEIEGGVGSIYGGGASPNDADNSGILQYIRIEFAGVPFVTDKEINGLTMGGVGSATTIDHIQISYSGDDAYEWFGGKVNCKNLVSFRTWDDDFDTDNGYQGMIQYAVALRDPDIADPGSKSNGFESDNDKDGTTNVPQTAPVFSNFSMFGPKVTAGTTINANYKNAMHLRRNTSLNLYNSFFAGYANGLLLDGALAEANATALDLNIGVSYLVGISGSEFQLASGSTFDLPTWFLTTMSCNDTMTANTSLMITDGFNLTAPNFLPQTGSPLLSRTWLDCNPAGVETIKGIESVTVYPNPVSQSAILDFGLTTSDIVTIEILDLTGRTVMTIQNAMMEAGQHSVSIDVSSMSNGMCFVRLTSNNSTHIQKLFVVK